jgi:hypothetical protein
VAGLITGLSAAAGGLALAGRTLFEMPVERAEVFLVVGPLAGLLPVSIGAWAAVRSPGVAARFPAAFGLWLACAVAATAWFGVYPLVR